MKLKNKKVLVTGADGFIGSHLVEMLVKSGAIVKALSHYNSFNYWGWLEGLDCLDDIEVICGDVRDPHFCKEITKDMDVIFHLAALIAIPYSYIAPDSYVDTNVKGTLNICQSAKENGCERVIHTSTSEVYGTAQYIPIDEKHPLQPQSPYSASKIGADHMAMSFYLAFGLPVTVARPFNTYGPRIRAGKQFGRVVPNFITQCLNNEPITVFGDGSQYRSFTYVVDEIEGIIKDMLTPAARGIPINVGNDKMTTVLELAELIKKLTKSESEIIFKNLPIDDPLRRQPILKRANEILNWKPQTQIESGLEKTIEWFKDATEKGLI